jgi:hypothetical protein
MLSGVHEARQRDTRRGAVTTTGSFGDEPVEADAPGMQTVLDASVAAWLGHLKAAAESSA